MKLFLKPFKLNLDKFWKREKPRENFDIVSYMESTATTRKYPEPTYTNEEFPNIDQELDLLKEDISFAITYNEENFTNNTKQFRVELEPDEVEVEHIEEKKRANLQS